MIRPKPTRTLGRWAMGAVAVMVMMVVPAAAAPIAPPGSGSGAPSTAPGAQVELNAYCDTDGASAQIAGGRTVYCAPVQGTDAHVWSYSHGPLRHDPNTRGYTCDDNGCRFPDGGPVPGYRRCGILCGEPPTSGDFQSGLADCFTAGTPFEECDRRIR
ncbi:hypothetical protein [Nocardia spumae]|uniref:hypothetical protein n=1 Tax=Nocardia spumae TaxID=2887190 RepID=UPI001D142540|nr:hypothetical protein [Nocardia spumae]